MSGTHLAGILTMTDTVDPKSFRKGDKVWVEGTLMFGERDEYGVWKIATKDGQDWIAVTAASIVAHHPAPRPIEVGDVVRLSSISQDKWIVKAICEGQALLKCGETHWWQESLFKLERLPQ